MSPQNKNVYSLPGHDIEKIAQATSGVNPLEVSKPTESLQPHSNKLLKRIGAGAVVGLLALGFAPRGEDGPRTEERTITEYAQETVHIPVNSETDTVILSVKTNPDNASEDTVSEAVLNNPKVQNYLERNPDEQESLVASANSLSAIDNPEVAVVERDIDKDGDTDAVVVPVK